LHADIHVYSDVRLSITLVISILYSIEIPHTHTLATSIPFYSQNEPRTLCNLLVILLINFIYPQMFPRDLSLICFKNKYSFRYFFSFFLSTSFCIFCVFFLFQLPMCHPFFYRLNLRVLVSFLTYL